MSQVADRIGRIFDNFRSGLIHRLQRSCSTSSIRLLRNVFGSNHRERALLSYIDSPFRESQDRPRHTNYFEARTWAKLLDQHGFCVDVCDYNHELDCDYSHYSVICGFGDSFERAMQTTAPMDPIKILYSPGCSTVFSNVQSAKRIYHHWVNSGVWAPAGGRFCPTAWPLQNTLCDVMVVLGNEFSASTYDSVYQREHKFSLPGFYLPDLWEAKPERTDDQERLKNLLWFGSSGLIHKGLDLVLRAIAQFPDMRLHIAGINPAEQFIVEEIISSLHLEMQVQLHGFLTVGEKPFVDVLSTCGGILFPSASEGGGPAVLTAVAHGALCPMVTLETSLGFDDLEIKISELSVDGVVRAINRYLSEGPDGITFRGKAAQQCCIEKYSLSNYETNLNRILTPFLNH